MRHGFLKKACVLFAVVFVLFQSFMLPMAMANGAWTGNSWTGNSWSGETWEGSSWTGDTWEGSAWTKEGWQGNSWDSNSGGSNSSPGISNEAGGGNGLIPSGSGTLKPLPPYVSDPYLPLQPTIDGDRENDNRETLLDQSVIPSNISKEQKDEDGGVDPWDVATYIGNDLVNGGVDFGASIIEQGENIDLKSTFGRPNFISGLILNGAKLPMGERTPKWFEIVEDVHTGLGMGVDIYKEYSNVAIATSATDDVVRGSIEILPDALNVTSSATGVLSKINIATSAVSTGFSLVNAIKSVEEAKEVSASNVAVSEKVVAKADAVSDIGEFTANAGMLVAAIPGGQVAGISLAVAGGGIWLAGKAVKWTASNWSSISKTRVGKAAKSVWKGITKPFKWLAGS
ncbi:hypothetical protein AC622_18425 [Bacillus sp. FJAT-27916]|uniref:hypothetical protein n=1 Tax=Bacillus sp. FJAT-27916 TaxID=1679169 RepID=UPI0006707D9C|nr:hypothetical protein [Bacillus sp. FJAT-27916]KMY45931.1 hypothetical protein AC622_18425 [Bacillus sp. FJAT-27916]